MGIKVLHVHSEIKPGGGPHGYLYNLQQAIEKEPEDKNLSIAIETFPVRSIKEQIKIQQTPSLLFRVKRRILSKIKNPNSGVIDLVTTIISEYSSRFSDINGNIASKWFDNDLLIVHDIFLAEKLISLFPAKSKDKLILITHSPTWFTWQTIGNEAPDIPLSWFISSPRIVQMVKREMSVLKSCRAVASPCLEAMDGYPEWQNLSMLGKTSSLYVETGVPRPSVKSDPQDLRKNWGIKEGQKIALFIGRPHPQKGFDKFVDWADYYKSTGREDWVFIQAGASANYKRDLSSIRPVGWLTDNGAAYQAADLVLIPNTFSYFDIGTLEALSLGAPIALSSTGGHRYLTRKFTEIPVIPFESPDKTWKQLEEIEKLYQKNDESKMALIKIWKDNFDLSHFLGNHKTMYHEALKTRTKL